MISSLLTMIAELDKRLFLFINVKLHNGFLAELMKYTANDFFLAAVVFAALFFALKKDNRAQKTALAFSLWALIFTNILSTHVLKPLFQRPRPVAEIPEAYMLFNMKKLNYAFPSTHTAMAAVLAFMLWKDFPGLRPYMAAFVAFVAFFCVYTGGHWPLDTLAGFALGIACGAVFNAMKERCVTGKGRENAG